jgi:GNAT superfamily N-acetyltransferase
MDITYRPARHEDLAVAARVVLEAGNALRVRHGFAPAAAPQPPCFQAFCLARDPAGLWVAESGSETVGFGFSWMLGKFWYLAQLFVAPGAQAKGVGQALLSKTLQQARRDGAENRTLITFGYNVASTGLYMNNGLYPREPLYRLTAPAPVVQRNDPATDYFVTPLAMPHSREWITRLDEEVLGFDRAAHYAFLLDGMADRAIRIEHAGRPVGYAYIAADGHVGPLAAAPDADPREVVVAAVRHALETRPRQVSLIVPGRADRILHAVGGLGFRVTEPYVLMSARPFGDWSRYLPSSPGYM